MKKFIRRQNGYGALVVALIGVTFTMLLVVPLLLTTETNLIGVRKSAQSLTGYNCDWSGAQHALWRLQNDSGFTGSITTSNPTASYQLPCGSGMTTVGVTLVSMSNPLPAYVAKYAYADIVLTADVTINSNNMVYLKEAANDIVNAFDFPDTGDRYEMGITRYGTSSQSWVPMTNDASTLQNGINNIDYNSKQLGNQTDLVNAINGAAAQFSTGMGDRPNVPNIVIFIMANNDSDGNSKSQLQSASASSGAEFFVVGVGSNASKGTMDAIASTPTSTHEFFSSTFQGLINLVGAIVASVQAAGNAGTVYDIQSVAADGSTVEMRVLITLDGNVVILSTQQL